MRYKVGDKVILKKGWYTNHEYVIEGKEYVLEIVSDAGAYKVSNGEHMVYFTNNDINHEATAKLNSEGAGKMENLKVKVLSKEHGEAVYHRLIEVGAKRTGSWDDEREEINAHSRCSLIIVNGSGCIDSYDAMIALPSYKTVTLDELYQMDKVKPPKTFKLNSAYTATIKDNGIEAPEIGLVGRGRVEELVNALGKKNGIDITEIGVVANSPEHAVAINKRLIELGAKNSEHTDRTKLSDFYPDDWPVMGVTPSGYLDGYQTHSSKKLVSLDDLYKQDAPRTVKLTDEYTAEINGDTVKIGCQSFKASKIKELWSEMNESN